MTQDYIDYEDLEDTDVDVLLQFSHSELEAYIRESRSILDNAQMTYDRLRAVRMEKIRRECIGRSVAEGLR